MSLHLTPENVQAAYEYLRTTQPFCGWNLPEGEDVKFRVIRDPRLYGWYQKSDVHMIAVSSARVKRTDCLMETVAHESIHLFQEESGIDRRVKAQHSKAFKLHAAEVCRHHGFDIGRF